VSDIDLLVAGFLRRRAHGEGKAEDKKTHKSVERFHSPPPTRTVKSQQNYYTKEIRELKMSLLHGEVISNSIHFVSPIPFMFFNSSTERKPFF